MATKTAFTLEDPFAEKVNDDYAQLTWANEQIYSVADGKHSLISHILKGDIKVEKSKWGLTGTYDQSAPIRTTRAMVKQLLRDEHIDLDRLKQILSGGQEDEASAAKFVRSLTDAAKAPHRSPKTAETQKIGEDDVETTQATPPKSFKELWDESTETYPFITKMILTCETPENRELRKSKRQFCVYELHIGGAFTDLKTAEQKVVKNSGYVPEDVLNEAMRSINTIVSKKVAKETLKKARFTDAVTSTQLHGYEIFKLLQKPSDNNLRNILHVSDAITDLERESKTPSARPEFEIAIKIENENLTDHQTFEILQDDPHKHKLGTKYVFAIKSDQNGEITRFKARLVAQGYNQIPGLEFGKSYAPVAKMSTILILMVLAVTLNLAIKLLDFKGAFLHSYMPDEYPVYIKTPHGFDIGPNHMLKLRKSLYGTRNAGYLWYEDLRAELLRQGFQQSIHDQCLFSSTKN